MAADKRYRPAIEKARFISLILSLLTVLWAYLYSAGGVAFQEVGNIMCVSIVFRKE
ncbi:MAG TPA: hypothetical protein VLA72_01475 [Anaerolineales bacterium]|nr:hypothetical protein [Anaerolineales bacterium]